MHKPDSGPTGVKHPGIDILRGQLQRNLDIQRMSWSELPEGARGLAENALK